MNFLLIAETAFDCLIFSSRLIPTSTDSYIFSSVRATAFWGWPCHRWTAGHPDNPMIFPSSSWCWVRSGRSIPLSCCCLVIRCVRKWNSSRDGQGCLRISAMVMMLLLTECKQIYWWTRTPVEGISSPARARWLRCRCARSWCRRGRGTWCGWLGGSSACCGWSLCPMTLT